MTDVFDSALPSEPPRPGSPPSTRDSGSDDDEFDDEITMRNHVSPLPDYEDGPAVNVFHGAHLVGGPEGVSEADLEVYLVEDGDDAELAVDREAFERLFGDDEAVDVEIPGRDLFCVDGFAEAARGAGDSDDDRATQLAAPDVSEREKSTTDDDASRLGGDEDHDEDSSEVSEEDSDPGGGGPGAQLLQ